MKRVVWMFVLCMTISLCFAACRKTPVNPTSDENVPDSSVATETQEEELPLTVTDEEGDEVTTADEEADLSEDEQTEENSTTVPVLPEDPDVLNVSELPQLPEEIHTVSFTGVTYLTPDGAIAGGGSLDENISLSLRLPDDVSCFPYQGDGNTPDWGLSLYKVATSDDFAKGGYYVIENTVDNRFVGFGNVSSADIYLLPNTYRVMEEKINYFEGGVGYNYYVRVDGEYIVKLAIAEADDKDADLYRAVVASFAFSLDDE